MSPPQKPFKNEYAPGIPAHKKMRPIPQKKGVDWEFTLHNHHAKRRGQHYDLRLGDPFTGHAHSWALTGSMPQPGNSTWAIQQPTHTVEYMDFKGILQDGYGAGRVDIAERGKTQILESSDDHIRFLVHKGMTPQMFVLHRIHDKRWKLFNKTLTDAHAQNIPNFKPTYTGRDYGDVDPTKKNEILMPKVDGAHNLILLPKTGQQIRVVSYRKPSRGDTGVIEHTFKFQDISGQRTPAGTGGTILRAEAYAVNPTTQEATEASTLAGLLNAKTPLSLSKQKTLGKLQLAPFDVVYYKGRDVTNKPYAQRLKILEAVVNALPEGVELPPIARTESEKKKLVERIQAGKLPLTREGVVGWDMTSPGAPTKYPIRPQFDVHIRDFFPGSGKLHGKGVGGFTYSHSEDGPIVGRVGTGFSDTLREDMLTNPDKYLGLIARIGGSRIQKRHGNLGAVQKPAFLDFHPDKNEPMRLQRV